MKISIYKLISLGSSFLLPGYALFFMGKRILGLGNFLLFIFFWILLRVCLGNENVSGSFCIILSLIIVVLVLASTFYAATKIIYLKHPLINFVAVVILAIVIWNPNGLLFSSMPKLTIYMAKGSSMRDAIKKGDFLIVREYKKGEVIKRNQIVIAALGKKNNAILEFHKIKPIDWIISKRVVGLPNDKVEHLSGILKIYTNPYFFNQYPSEEFLPNVNATLGKNKYFLLGDNHKESTDSRSFGAIDKNNIYGLVVRTIFPKLSILKKASNSITE